MTNCKNDPTKDLMNCECESCTQRKAEHARRNKEAVIIMKAQLEDYLARKAAAKKVAA